MCMISLFILWAAVSAAASALCLFIYLSIHLSIHLSIYPGPLQESAVWIDESQTVMPNLDHGRLTAAVVAKEEDDPLNILDEGDKCVLHVLLFHYSICLLIFPCGM